MMKLWSAALAAALMSAAQAQEPGAEYRVGAGDGIRISVFQNPNLTLETRVSEDGTISYPMLGRVRIGGMTLSGAEQTIASDRPMVMVARVTTLIGP